MQQMLPAIPLLTSKIAELFAQVPASPSQVEGD